MLPWMFKFGHFNGDMGNTQRQVPEEALCHQDTRGLFWLVQLYVMPSFFLAVLVVGLPLNLLSLWVFFRRLRRWTRGTVFLFNLSLADTSWLLALPFLVRYHLDRLYWRLGLPFCAAVRTLYHNYFYLSIFFVTCVSVDRYLAIVHPLRSLVLLGRRQTCALCGAVWAAALVLSVPVASMTLIQTCPASNRTVCTLYVLLSDATETLPYSLACSVIGFLLPLFSICYCGLRSVGKLRRDPHNRRRRLRRVLCAALVIFALFYLPYHLSRNAAIAMRAARPGDPASWRHADLLFSLEMCFCSLITCVNPLFSCFIGRQFKREFHGTFASLFTKCPNVKCPRFSSMKCPLQQTRMKLRKTQRMATVSPMCALPAATIDPQY